MSKYWITGTNQLHYWDGASWTSQTLPGGVGRLWSIHGINDQTIFAVGQDNTGWYSSTLNPVFLWTTDGGVTWNSEASQIATDIPVNTGYTFFGVHAFSANDVWIVGHEFFSSQDYYLWQWNGSSFTQKGGIIDPHCAFLWGSANNDIMISSGGPNPASQNYVHWNGAATSWPNGITGISKGGPVVGLSSTDVVIIDNSNPYVLTQGYHGGSWNNATLKTGFYTNFDGDYQNKLLAMDPSGNIYVAAYDTTATEHQVAIGTIGGGFSYHSLGASVNNSSVVAANSATDACCVYSKTVNDQASYFYNGSTWTAGPDITSMLRCYSIYGYEEAAPVGATGTAADLETPIGVARNCFLKIHGFEPIYWQWSSKGEPEDYSRSIITCLKPPAEFSVGLNLSVGLPEISAMTFKFSDIRDTDTTFYWAKQFATARWDDNPHCRVSGTITADQTTINCVDTSTMPSEGIAYIGNETISYGGKTSDTLTDVERDLYPSIAETNLGKYYEFPNESNAGYKMAVGTVPFTMAGRQVSLYVVTWNRETEQWNSEDDALLAWTGRITDQINYNGKEGEWEISCESLVKDFDQKIANYTRQSPIAKLINLSGQDVLIRRFIIYVRNEDLEVVGFLVVNPPADIGSVFTWINHINNILEDPVFYNKDQEDWFPSKPPFFDIRFQLNQYKIEIKISSILQTYNVKINYNPSQHLFQALGFDVNEDNSFQITFDEVVISDYNYHSIYQAKNEPYLAYQPIDMIVAGSQLAIEKSEPLLTTQGDTPYDLAAVRIKKVKITKKEYDLYYRYYEAADGQQLNGLPYIYLDLAAPDANVDQFYPRDFFGYRRQDEPIMVEQIFLPWPYKILELGGAEFVPFEYRGPFELLLRVLTSTGTRHHNGEYDELPWDFGIGIHQSLVDHESFIEGDSLVAGKELSYRYFYPIEDKTVKDLIKAECVLFGFAVTWINGKFKLVQTMPPAIDTIDVTIDESVIIDPEWQPSFSLSSDQVINQYDCHIVFNYSASKFEAPLVVSDSDSIKSMNQTRPVKIEHKGIRHISQLEELNGFLDTQLLSRFLRFPMPVLSSVPLAPTLINKIFVGDTVIFQSNKTPDPFGSGTKNINAYALVLDLSWNYVTWIGRATLMIISAAKEYGAHMAAAAVNDLGAANGGWSVGSFQMTLEPYTYGNSSTDPKDGQRFLSGEFVRIVERAPSDPDNPQFWGPFELAKDFEADGADLLTFVNGTTLTGWTSSTEYIIIPGNYDEIIDQQILDAAFISDINELLEGGVRGYLIG